MRWAAGWKTKMRFIWGFVCTPVSQVFVFTNNILKQYHKNPSTISARINRNLKEDTHTTNTKSFRIQNYSLYEKPRNNFAAILNVLKVNGKVFILITFIINNLKTFVRNGGTLKNVCFFSSFCGLKKPSSYSYFFSISFVLGMCVKCPKNNASLWICSTAVLISANHRDFGQRADYTSKSSFSLCILNERMQAKR